MTLELSFHGAAGTVTGSRHLLRTADRTVLVDAGLFQGLKELRLRNWQRPAFDPERVDHLLLTHTHIDHAGYLPKLVREGFRGPVHCTPATLDLARILLLDAARIQEEDAAHANRKGYTRHRPALPLYTEADAEKALGLFAPVDYGEWIGLGGGMQARFTNAGHILGSAHVEVRVEADGGVRRIVFSGDVGRYSMPLHPDPTSPPVADVVVVESTYGDREHEHVTLLDQIAGPVAETFRRGGTVLVPAFAVGRAQLVTLLLSEAMEEGRIPEAPIHIDSPMATDATAVYARHVDAENLDRDLVADLGGRLFPRRVRLHRSVAESKELNGLSGPRVIISSSGMLTGGRVLHHLGRLLPGEDNLLVLVGYQAAGTRGRRLIEGAEKLRMHGRDIPVRCRFVNAHGLSAHADRNGLLRWLEAIGGPPRRVFVTHGEPDSAAALAARIREETGAEVHVPAHGEAFPLSI